jgi:hypothetical protein
MLELLATECRNIQEKFGKGLRRAWLKIGSIAFTTAGRV